MLKKINSGADAGKLKPGDYIFDGPVEEKARKFKIKKIVFNLLIVFHGGEFPSIKFLRKQKISSGNWWMRH